jgi:2-oxoglutarate ferredoxin oxidoreductase subunit delta
VSPARRRATAIAVDLTLCKTCGICHAICPRDVFDLDELGQPAAARLADCTVCFACEWHCPDFAIEIAYEDAPRAEKAPAAEKAGAGTRAAPAKKRGGA